jgi:hypothetical protein
MRDARILYLRARERERRVNSRSKKPSLEPTFRIRDARIRFSSSVPAGDVLYLYYIYRHEFESDRERARYRSESCRRETSAWDAAPTRLATLIFVILISSSWPQDYRGEFLIMRLPGGGRGRHALTRKIISRDSL